jgi:hypothetical protein
MVIAGLWSQNYKQACHKWLYGDAQSFYILAVDKIEITRIFILNNVKVLNFLRAVKSVDAMKRPTVFPIIPIIMLFSAGLVTIINTPEEYSTIQAGINASTNGDTILVQPGTYSEIR